MSIVLSARQLKKNYAGKPPVVAVNEISFH